MEHRSNYLNVTATEIQSNCNAMPSNANQERDLSKECLNSQHFQASKLTCSEHRDTKTRTNRPTTNHTRKKKVMEQSFMLVDKNSGSFLTELDDKFDLSASKKSKSDFKKSGQKFSDFNANYSSTTSSDLFGHKGNDFSSNKPSYFYNESEEDDSLKDGLPVYFGSQRDIVDLYQGTAQKSTKTRLSSSSFASQSEQNMPDFLHHTDKPKQQDSDLDKTPEELFPFYEDDDSSESLTDFADELFDFITNPDAGSAVSWSETPFHERPLLSDDEFEPDFYRSVQVTDLDALLMGQNVRDNLPNEQNYEQNYGNEIDRINGENVENKTVTHYDETELSFDCDEQEEEVIPQRRNEILIAGEEKIPSNENNALLEHNESEGNGKGELEIDSIKLDLTSSLTERTSHMEQLSFEEEIIADESLRDNMNIHDLFLQNYAHNDQIGPTLDHIIHESCPNRLVSENVINSQENVKTTDQKDVWNFLSTNNSHTTAGPSEVTQRNDKNSNTSSSLEASDNVEGLQDENAISSDADNCCKVGDDRGDVCRDRDIYTKGDDEQLQVECTVERESEGGGIDGIYNGNLSRQCSGDGVIVDDGDNSVLIVINSDVDSGGVDGVVDSGDVGGGGGDALASCKISNIEENGNYCQNTPAIDIGKNDVNVVGSVAASSRDDDDKCESGLSASNNLDESTICPVDVNEDDYPGSTDVIVYPEIIVHALEIPDTEAKFKDIDDVKVQETNDSVDQERNGRKFQDADSVNVREMKGVREQEMHEVAVQGIHVTDVQGIHGTDVQEIYGTDVQKLNANDNQQINAAKFQEINGDNVQEANFAEVHEISVEKQVNCTKVQQTDDVLPPKEHSHTSNSNSNQTCEDLIEKAGHLVPVNHSSVFDGRNTEGDLINNINIEEVENHNIIEHSESSVLKSTDELRHCSAESDFTIVSDKQSELVEVETNSTAAYAKATNTEQHVNHSTTVVVPSKERYSKEKQSENHTADDSVDDMEKSSQENHIDKSKNIAPSKSRAASGNDIIIIVDNVDDNEKSNSVKGEIRVTANKPRTTSNAKSKSAKVTRISSSKAASSGRASSAEKTSRRSRKSRGSDSEHLRNLKSTKLTEKSLKKHSRHLSNDNQQSPEQPLGEAPESPRSPPNELSLDERILNVNRSIDWVRKVIMEMRAQDFTLKLQFDGLRQEIRTLKQEFEQFGVNCECYDDEELKKLDNIHNKPNTHKTHVNTNTAIKQDSGYHSDASSVSDTKDDGKTKVTSVTKAKFLYEPIPSFPKVQTMSSGKCVFEIVL